MNSEDNGMEINGRKICGDMPPYIVAEIGINHNGSPETAEALVRAAKLAGVDAAKLQVFAPEKFMARSSPYFSLLADCALEAGTIRSLMATAQEVGITLFSAVFDEGSADLLNDVGAPAFKVASGDLTHLPLLRHIAGFGKPMIVSTGGGTMLEVQEALDAIRDVRLDIPIALFHCVSNYPTEASDANLACMASLREAFGVPVGFSDHTQGNAVSIAAAALGAELLEKHFTLSRSAEGPDHALSVDPQGMEALVKDVLQAYSAIGRTDKTPVEPADFIPQMRRSVTADREIPMNVEITRDMLEIKRPGTGIAPKEIDKVVGRKAARYIAADTVLTWEDIV